VKKYVAVAASIVVQLCLGGILAWSIYERSLTTVYGLSAGQAGFIFGAYIAVFTVGILVGGRIQEALGPRRTAFIGALLAGGGWLLASASGGHFYLLLAGVSLLVGCGHGFVYVCPLVTCVKWFPARPGLATGLAVVGTGAGAIALTAFAEPLLARGWDVLAVYRLIGFLYGSIMLLCAALLFLPPGDAIAVRRRVPLGHLLAARRFWALFIGLFGGTFGALMILGHLKPIGLLAGQSETVAALAVVLFAAGNGAGRLVWGAVYDRLGRRAIPLSLLTLLVGILVLLAARVEPVFLVNAFWLGTAFGACMVLYASDVATFWGSDRVGSVYPIIYLAYGVSGLASPGTGGWIKDLCGNYFPAILLAATIVAAGMVAYWLLTRERRR
jgi:OFA family oxalate/formate antiporter-like MFS transporter